MILRLGDTIDAYRVLGTLGSGGSGAVYRVEHTITGRVEAMKVLHRGYLESPEEEQRFLREIRLHAVLNHPNIVAVHNALRVGDDLVMIMEYVEGQSVAKLLEQGPLPLMEALDVIGQALTALEFAHAYEITHRDLTPANLMVTEQGLVKLMDFGLALQQTAPRLTQNGAPVGSYAYMSPEQVRAEPVDFRTDIYSLGAVLFELLTGRKPFECDSAYALMRAHTVQKPPVPSQIEPDLPPVLDRLVLRALEKEPELRYHSAGEFRNALQNAIHEIVHRPEHREEAPAPPPRFSPTAKFLMMLAASFLIFVLVGVATMLTSPGGNIEPGGTAAAAEPGEVAGGPEAPAGGEGAALPVFEPPPFPAAKPKGSEAEAGAANRRASKRAASVPAKKHPQNP
ncbi:MAG: serine/threonine-protein kinase [Bryobacteraceae bacterium]